jgi:hypothetical protein
MARRGFRLALTLIAPFSFSMFSSVGKAYTPEQQQLCSNDAVRLCSSEIPDVDRITACMNRQREQLSPGCKAFFPPDDPITKKNKKPRPAT